MKALSLKIPEEVDRMVSVAAKRRGMRKSAVVREALQHYLDERREIRKGSFLDLAGSLVDCVKDAPVDLSSNPKHLDGYAFPPHPFRHLKSITGSSG